MTSFPLFIIGSSLLLMIKHASLAFQPSPWALPIPQYSDLKRSSSISTTSDHGLLGLSHASSRRRTNNIISQDQYHCRYGISGSGVIITHAFSSSDEDYIDDEDGYEIRIDQSGISNSSMNRGRRSVETTFGAENVPVDQRPSNEYLNLIQQPTFAWASQESGDTGLILRLMVTYVAFFVLICYPISGATWINEGYFLQKVTASNVGALSVVLILVLRLYSGWGYIGSRLQSKVIEYEETGWYDGDFEEKSDAEKARDLFLYRSNVKPVEERLQRVALAVGGAWLASCLALNVATSMNPIFNQYDPKMLEKLSYDDKVAEVVQRQSNGRPTYCENRYYRAVANGGQGTI